MTLCIARQDFAIDSAAVRGILPARELELVESAPGLAGFFGPCICGFATLRGRDVPVIDLRAKLRLPHAAPGRRACIVVVEIPGPGGPRLAGFVADRVSNVVPARARDFSHGKLRLTGRPRRLLDLDALLAQ